MISFRAYVVRYRLKETCRLLGNPGATVSDVAFAVGFNDHPYFARTFKRHFGVCPSSLIGKEDSVPGKSAAEILHLVVRLAPCGQ